VSNHQSPLSILFITGALVAGTAWAGLQEDADQYFAENRWEEASAAYAALLREDNTNASNWFNLARTQQELEKFSASRTSYESALKAGYQPEARARFFLARVFMSLDESDQALNQLEEIARTGGPNYRAVQNTPEFEPIANDPRFMEVIEALKPCTGDEYRQFDFWLGHWDVTPAGSAQPNAENRISSIQDGCVVLEQYTAGYFTGTSLNFYDAVTKSWHQTWMSNSGGALYLQGGINAAGSMVMSDEDLPVSQATGTVNRITWTPNDDGTVRQLWESSGDRGATWAVVFDGTYTSKGQPASG